MKLIEALKEVKANKQKVADLQTLIAKNSAHLNIHSPEYEDPKTKVAEWVQSCVDLSKRNIHLLLAIQKTNLQTIVSIKLGDNTITAQIAYWVWRAREYAKTDFDTYSKLTDKGLQDGKFRTGNDATSTVDVKLIRNYDPAQRDKMLMIYKGEKAAIDSALEVANAITELVE